jgi:glycosidase
LAVEQSPTITASSGVRRHGDRWLWPAYPPTAAEAPPAWVADAVFYQIFPDRFARSPQVAKPAGLEAWGSPPTVHGYQGGDLIGVVEHLDWLVDLGVNAVYLNPIFQSASNHRYHTHDYYRVDPLLGGNEAFAHLVEACHDRGIKVVLDGVFNHASRGFLQFNDLLENGEQSPWADWWVIHDWPLNAYDPDGRANYDAWWGIPALPEFNTANSEVREYLMQVAEHWAAQGIDGWRLDVPAEITTEGFWEEFRTRVRRVNPDLYIVGELWHDASDWINDGTRFDGAMNYLFTGYTVSFAAGASVVSEHTEGLSYQATPALNALTYGDRIDQLLNTYREQATLANLNLLGSHDTVRLLTLAGDDRASVVLCTLLLLTFPGAPCIYYGDEVGMPGARDPDNRRAFPWHDVASWDRDLLEAHRALIALRHHHPALRSGDYRRIWPPAGEGGRMLHLALRRGGDERLMVAVNAGDEAEVAVIARVDLPTGAPRLLWGEGALTTGEHHVRITVPPRSGAVFDLD